VGGVVGAVTGAVTLVGWIVSADLRDALELALPIGGALYLAWAAYAGVADVVSFKGLDSDKARVAAFPAGSAFCDAGTGGRPAA
jgi:hypothetical protein